MVWMLVGAGLSWAQEPATEAPSGADGATMYLVQDAASVRFLGEAFAGPEFEGGEAVTVVMREGGKVRVFAEERFGWIEPDALTAEAPAPPPGLTLPAGGGSSLLGELPPLLQNPPAPAPAAPVPAAPAPAAPAPAEPSPQQ
jgi:hypothetical protein